ncbi:RepB family plasmid replication initiator protein [Lactiplantibacillus plantarum]|uniref:RepB family plasmid replication initiator protein n=1 Tax=Lactiplantibacillus plantarum TaxID=1590 RepID=UPI0007B55AD1|nr:RepB family plasmid replication initiator protein [Lactiplantibacillus plantarum]KZU18126.1 Replication protein [Lactiplantibacillus plantarum]
MNSINKNELIDNKQVMHLKEINKRKVAEHNDLISSVAKMDKTPLKMFELAVSAIDTENPPKDNIVYLSKKELFSFFKVDNSNKYSRFRKAIKKMHEQAYFEIRELSGKKCEMKSISPITYAEWNNYNDIVTIEFNHRIMPYLIDLKQNFTQYALSDVVELKSKYSIILYKWLSMSYNQFEYYSSKGGRRDDQIEEYRNPSISMEELRRLTNTTEDYQRFTNFSKKVLDIPLSEINEHTHFNVTYDKIRKGRAIDSIVFHITKKFVADDNSYKQDDPAYLAEKEQKTADQIQLFVDGTQSRYTKILRDKWVLSAEDTTDIPTMAGLQKNVYPLYDELESLRGLNGVKDHISYVADKKEGTTKRNIAKYLKKAIEQYLVTVKIQDQS